MKAKVIGQYSKRNKNVGQGRLCHDKVRGGGIAFNCCVCRGGGVGINVLEGKLFEG